MNGLKNIVTIKMALNRNIVKIGDKVNVITDSGLTHIKHKELRPVFKCVYCVITDIDATGCRVNLVDYKGIVKARTYLYYTEMEKINE